MKDWKVGLVVPVYKNFPGFAALMASVDRCVVPYIIKNWEDNVGVSGGWNEGLRRAIDDDCDAVVIPNDDIIFEPGTINKMLAGLTSFDLVTAFNTRDENYSHLDEPHFIDSPDFACFAVKPKEFVDGVGWFDEGFRPAYFEDNDMHYRMQLVGMEAKKRTDAPMFHAGSVTQNWDGQPVVDGEMFEMNRAYYGMKWGGWPGEEKFKTPFNNPDNTVKDCRP